MLLFARLIKATQLFLLTARLTMKKMQQILSDETKFSMDKKQKDCTLDLEKQVSSHLSDLVKKGALRKKTAAKLTPRGSSLPRLYGLPTTHKPDVPLRPILSMIGSPTHKLAQWLASCLVPVTEHLCKFPVQDSFEFVEKIRRVNIKDKFMCSFDVTSLFTNVPLEETVDIIEFLISKLNINMPIPPDQLHGSFTTLHQKMFNSVLTINSLLKLMVSLWAARLVLFWPTFF